MSQHDDRLSYLRLFYNGSFSIASKNDLDDKNLLLAITFQICLSTLSNLTTFRLRLDYSGTKIIQFFIVTNRFSDS
jgi:hypothetical protein